MQNDPKSSGKTTFHTDHRIRSVRSIAKDLRRRTSSIYSTDSHISLSDYPPVPLLPSLYRTGNSMMFSNTTKSKPDYSRVPSRKPVPSSVLQPSKMTQAVPRAEKPLTRANISGTSSIYFSSEANAMSRLQEPTEMEARKYRWNDVIPASHDSTRTFAAMPSTSNVQEYKPSSHRPAQLNYSANPPPKSPSRKAWHQMKNSVSSYAKSPFHRTKGEPNPLTFRKTMAQKTGNNHIPPPQPTVPPAPAKHQVRVVDQPNQHRVLGDFVGYFPEEHKHRVTTAANAPSVLSRHPARAVNHVEASDPTLMFRKQNAANPYQAVTAPGLSNQQIHRQGTPHPNKYRPSLANMNKPLPPQPAAYNNYPTNKVPNISYAAYTAEQPHQKISTVPTHHYDRVDPPFRPLSTHPSISDIGHGDNLSRHGTRKGVGRNSPVSPLTDSGSNGSGYSEVVDTYMRGKRPINYVSRKPSTSKKYGGNYSHQDEATRVWRSLGDKGLGAQEKAKGKGRSRW